MLVEVHNCGRRPTLATYAETLRYCVEHYPADHARLFLEVAALEKFMAPEKPNVKPHEDQRRWESFFDQDFDMAFDIWKQAICYFGSNANRIFDSLYEPWMVKDESEEIETWAPVPLFRDFEEARLEYREESMRRLMPSYRARSNPVVKAPESSSTLTGMMSSMTVSDDRQTFDAFEKKQKVKTRPPQQIVQPQEVLEPVLPGERMEEQPEDQPGINAYPVSKQIWNAVTKLFPVGAEKSTMSWNEFVTAMNGLGFKDKQESSSVATFKARKDIDTAWKGTFSAHRPHGRAEMTKLSARMIVTTLQSDLARAGIPSSCVR